MSDISEIKAGFWLAYLSPEKVVGVEEPLIFLTKSVQWSPSECVVHAWGTRILTDALRVQTHYSVTLERFPPGTPWKPMQGRYSWISRATPMQPLHNCTGQHPSPPPTACAECTCRKRGKRDIRRNMADVWVQFPNTPLCGFRSEHWELLAAPVRLTTHFDFSSFKACSPRYHGVSKELWVVR